MQTVFLFHPLNQPKCFHTLFPTSDNGQSTDTLFITVNGQTLARTATWLYLGKTERYLTKNAREIAAEYVRVKVGVRLSELSN